VAIVAPTLAILGGQAVQADRLLRLWRDDTEIDASLVPVNPDAGPVLRIAQRIKYVRTAVTEAIYWPLLAHRLRHVDVVHVFSASYFSFILAPWPAVRIAHALGKPVLLNYRSGEAPDHLARSALARRTLRSVALNVVPSAFLRNVFAGFQIDATIIPNFVDVDRFSYRPRVPLQPKVLSTRNLEPLYNVACTLRAFRAIQNRYPNASLTIVGSGSQDAALRGLAAELGLANVAFAGRVAPAEIWRFYAEADIYLQSPDIDNMPGSVLEAWASGLPVVSTEAGGVPALVTDGETGLLVPLGDHAALADRVLRLLDDRGLAAQLAAEGRRAVEAFTWPRIRGQWVQAYHSLATAPELARRTVRAQ
jgi:glycosyltransferase involved in cell wall biosynthesis